MTQAELTWLDAMGARRWVVLTRTALAAHRAELNALNVYPVPDGDTGTNMFLTLDVALDTAQWRNEPPNITKSVSELTRATLLSARGNSGVIFSQLIRGIGEVFAKTAPRGLDATGLATALRRADVLARASVSKPVEGTILTVATGAADAAEEAAAAAATLIEVAEAALRGGREALARTPDLLPQLAEAGVVDAGGAGYVLVLESLERAVRGEVPHDDRGGERADWHVAAMAGAVVRACGAEEGTDPDGPGPDDAGTLGGPAYEVMYLLTDATEEAADGLRRRLDDLGDSVLVVGSSDVWNVHAHVDDVGAAIEAGVEIGRPHRIRVTHFGDERPLVGQRPRTGQAVVSCAAGPGLADLFRSAGAAVVDSGPGRRASAGMVLRAIESAGVTEVIVLPNDKDTELAAQAAAEVAKEQGVRGWVLPARSPAQGIAALAVFDAGATIEDNADAMTRAIEATRYGAVGIAARSATTAAGPCLPGDALGSAAGAVVAVGRDVAGVAAAVLLAMGAGTAELVTVIVGASAGAGLAERLVAQAELDEDLVDVFVVEGGQEHYPLFLGVE